MAKIPQFNSSGVSSAPTPIPTQSVSEAGIVGEAVSKLGQQASAFFGDLAEKRSRIETEQFANSKARDLEQELRLLVINEKSKRAGTDFKNFATDVSNIAENRKQEILKTAPSKGAANRFSERVDGVIKDSVFGATVSELTEKSKYYVNEEERSIENTANSFYLAPDPFAAAIDLVRRDNELEANKDLYGDKTQELKDRTGTLYRQATIQGMIRDGFSFIPDNLGKEEKMKIADEFLAGKVRGTEPLLKGMGVKETANYREAIRTHFDAQERKQIQEIASDIGPAVSALSSSPVLTGQLSNQVNSVMNKVRQLPDGGEVGDFKRETLKNLVDAKAVGSFIGTIARKSSAELAAIKPEDIVKTAGLDTFVADKQFQQKVASAITQNIRERNEDGAAYVQKYFPAQAKNIATSVALQKSLGVSSPRIMSKSESELKSSAILEGPSAKDRVVALGRLADELTARGDGSYILPALAQMNKDNKNFDQSYIFAASFDSPISRERVISNSMRAKDIKTNFKATHGAQEKTVDMAISSGLNDLTLAYSRVEDQGILNDVRNVIELDAKDQINRNPSLAAKDAVNTAYQRVIGSNFETFRSPAPDVESVILMPKSLGADPRVVQNYLSQKPTAEDFKKLKVDGLSNRYAGDNFYEAAKDGIFWAPNGDGTGVVLRHSDPKYGIKTLKNSSGTPVELKFIDMQVRQEQSWMDKLEGIKEGIRNRVK